MNQTKLSFTRRECLGAAALLGMTPRLFAGAAFRGPLGVQLYTVRDALQKQPEETVKAVAAIGYTQVEVTLNSSFASLYPLLKKYNLDVVSGHFQTPLITGDPSGWNAAVDQAHGAGLKYMVLAYLQKSERGGADSYRRLADQLNHAAPVCQKAGITLAYHNHAFEFGKIDGVRPIDILLERLEPLVKLEMDVFWVSVAGEDPAALLRKHPGRVALAHLKDKAPGAPSQYDESVPHDAFKEVGSGSLDFPAILRAAKDAGVQRYFVEQDYCAGDPVDSLRKSYQYLRGK